MTQSSQIANWPANRLAEARAVVADVAHHSDHLIRLAPADASTDAPVDTPVGSGAIAA